MEGFAVTCPLAPDASRLISGFCSSPRSFGLGFLQTPPRDDALAFLLAFGSAKTWQSDFHRLSNVPCPAHTSGFRRAPLAARRPASRCSVARALKMHCLERLQTPVRPFADYRTVRGSRQFIGSPHPPGSGSTAGW